MKRKRWKHGQVEDRVRAILRCYGYCTSTFVAERLWPKSPGWDRPQGRGAQGLARAAARILHRLRRQGLAEDDLSVKGVVRWRASTR